MMWLNGSVAIINAPLQLLDIYRYRLYILIIHITNYRRQLINKLNN